MNMEADLLNTGVSLKLEGPQIFVLPRRKQSINVNRLPSYPDLAREAVRVEGITLVISDNGELFVRPAFL